MCGYERVREREKTDGRWRRGAIIEAGREILRERKTDRKEKRRTCKI